MYSVEDLQSHMSPTHAVNFRGERTLNDSQLHLQPKKVKREHLQEIGPKEKIAFTVTWEKGMNQMDGEQLKGRGGVLHHDQALYEFLAVVVNGWLLETEDQGLLKNLAISAAPSPLQIKPSNRTL